MVVPQIGAFEARVEPASAAQASRVSALEAAAVSTSDAEAAARRAVAAVAALEARFAVADAPLRDCAGAIEGADSYDEYAAAERAYDALLASARADFPGDNAALSYMLRAAPLRFAAVAAARGRAELAACGTARVAEAVRNWTGWAVVYDGVPHGPFATREDAAVAMRRVKAGDCDATDRVRRPPFSGIVFAVGAPPQRVDVHDVDTRSEAPRAVGGLLGGVPGAATNF